MQPTLMSLLNELTMLCQQQTGRDAQISVILPKAVLEEFSRQARPKERIRLFGENNPPTSLLKTVHGCGGTVKLYGDDEATVLEYTLEVVSKGDSRE